MRKSPNNSNGTVRSIQNIAEKLSVALKCAPTGPGRTDCRARLFVDKFFIDRNIARLLQCREMPTEVAICCVYEGSQLYKINSLIAVKRDKCRHYSQSRRLMNDFVRAVHNSGLAQPEAAPDKGAASNYTHPKKIMRRHGKVPHEDQHPQG